MTSLADDFFEKRTEEIDRWASKGFIELHDFLKGTGFILEDLETIGILQKKFTFSGLEELDGHEPTPEWQEQFREGDCMTTFLPCELSNRLIKVLADNVEVRKRVESRQELYQKRKVALEKRRILEEKEKDEEREKLEEKKSLQQDDLTKKSIYEFGDKMSTNESSATSSDKVSNRGENENRESLSTTGLVAVPCVLLLSAMILRYLGSHDSPGPLEWALIALFSYSPMRYILRSGMENAGTQLKALAIGSIMFLVIGAGISNCSGTSTSSSNCWYMVGCI